MESRVLLSLIVALAISHFSQAVIWQDGADGKIPSNSLGFPSRFGDKIYFCKATYEDAEFVGTIVKGDKSCSFVTSHEDGSAQSSTDYQVFALEKTDGNRTWIYGSNDKIPKNAVTCGPDCYLGQSVYGDGLCLESIGRISPEKNLILMTKDGDSKDHEKEIALCPFFMFMVLEK